MYRIYIHILADVEITFIVLERIRAIHAYIDHSTDWFIGLLYSCMGNLIAILWYCYWKISIKLVAITHRANETYYSGTYSSKYISNLDLHIYLQHLWQHIYHKDLDLPHKGMIYLSGLHTVLHIWKNTKSFLIIGKKKNGQRFRYRWSSTD